MGRSGAMDLHARVGSKEIARVCTHAYACMCRTPLRLVLKRLFERWVCAYVMTVVS